MWIITLSRKIHKQYYKQCISGVICIVGGLTFLPALSLGPIAEQVMMQAGRL